MVYGAKDGFLLTVMKNLRTAKQHESKNTLSEAAAELSEEGRHFAQHCLQFKGGGLSILSYWFLVGNKGI